MRYGGFEMLITNRGSDLGEKISEDFSTRIKGRMDKKTGLEDEGS